MTRPSHINIDCTAVKTNFLTAKKCAPEAKVLACVKADAYGHGMIPVALTLSNDADAFGVACLEEAILLRKAGVKKPILLLEGIFEASEVDEIAAHDLWVVVHSSWQIELLKRAASSSQLKVWLKMDSGMHRLGFSPESYARAYEEVSSLDCVTEIVHMTHFSSADELDNNFTEEQFSVFDKTSSAFAGLRSTSNSAAIMAWEKTHLDWVRPGFMLYGASPFSQAHSVADTLVPAMELISQVIAVRDIEKNEAVGYNHSWRAGRASKIAVVAIGYGDGYPRNTANGTPVMINGARAKTVGHVAMDMLLADVTDMPDVAVGDPVELWGKNLPITEVAASSGYSPYELMTRLTSRLKRISIKAS